MISCIIFKDNKVLLNKLNNKYIFPKYEIDNKENLINIINKEFNTSVKVLDNITKNNINVYILSTNNISLDNNLIGYNLLTRNIKMIRRNKYVRKK